jgi:hypothetical protein
VISSLTFETKHGEIRVGSSFLFALMIDNEKRKSCISVNGKSTRVFQFLSGTCKPISFLKSGMQKETSRVTLRSGLVPCCSIHIHIETPTCQVL